MMHRQKIAGGNRFGLAVNESMKRCSRLIQVEEHGNEAVPGMVRAGQPSLPGTAIIAGGTPRPSVQSLLAAAALSVPAKVGLIHCCVASIMLLPICSKFPIPVSIGAMQTSE